MGILGELGDVAPDYPYSGVVSLQLLAMETPQDETGQCEVRVYHEGAAVGRLDLLDTNFTTITVPVTTAMLESGRRACFTLESRCG